MSNPKTRDGETLVYNDRHNQLCATHDESGLFYIHLKGIGWATITPDQAAEFAAKLSTASFPFQRGSRR